MPDSSTNTGSNAKSRPGETWKKMGVHVGLLLSMMVSVTVAAEGEEALRGKRMFMSKGSSTIKARVGDCVRAFSLSGRDSNPQPAAPRTAAPHWDVM